MIISTIKCWFEDKQKTDTKHDTVRNYSILPLGSAVALQRKDGDRWTHGTRVGKGDHNYHDHSYMI